MDRKLSLLLSGLAYLEIEGSNVKEINEGASLNINTFLNEQVDGDNENAIKINENKGTHLDDTEIIAVEYDKTTGMEAIAIKHGDEITISYRGTEDREEFIKTDIGDIFTGNYDGQFDKAKEFYDKVASENSENKINLTGHSLGGALAQYVALSTDDISRLNDVTTFSAPGIFPGYEGFQMLRKYKENKDIYDSMIINYARESDPVVSWGGNVGTTYVYNQNINLPFSGHGIAGYYEVIDLSPEESYEFGEKILPPYLTGKEKFQSVKDFYDTASTAQIRRRDPLVLDLDGDGIEIDPLGSGAYFDLDRNGFAEETAWMK